MFEYRVIETTTLEAFEAELNRWAGENYVISICEHDATGSWWAIMERAEEEL